MKTSRIVLAAAVLAAATLALAGCSQATGTTASDTVSTTVYDLPLTYVKANDTAGKHPGLSLAVKPASTVAITKATVVFSLTSSAVSGGLNGSSWEFDLADWSNKAWANGTNGKIAGGTWTSAVLTSAQIAAAYSDTASNTAKTSTTVTSVGGNVVLVLWSDWSAWADISGGHLYVKSVVLEYADSTTETITPKASLVGSGTDAWRLSSWTGASGTDGMTLGTAAISTVAF